VFLGLHLVGCASVWHEGSSTGTVLGVLECFLDRVGRLSLAFQVSGKILLLCVSGNVVVNGVTLTTPSHLL